MEIEERSKRENKLLRRTELEFVLHHPGEETPERDSVRALIADYVGGAAENTIVDSLNSEFGRGSTKGYAKIYEDKDDVLEVEDEHQLVRNGLKEA